MSTVQPNSLFRIVAYFSVDTCHLW